MMRNFCCEKTISRSIEELPEEIIMIFHILYSILLIERN